MNVIKEMKEVFETGYLREWFTYDAQYDQQGKRL